MINCRKLYISSRRMTRRELYIKSLKNIDMVDVHSTYTYYKRCHKIICNKQKMSSWGAPLVVAYCYIPNSNHLEVQLEYIERIIIFPIKRTDKNLLFEFLNNLQEPRKIQLSIRVSEKKTRSTHTVTG